jgi:hypothetical protein
MGCHLRGWRMTHAQSFLLGWMVAWTPSLVLFAWCLRKGTFFKEVDSDSK